MDDGCLICHVPLVSIDSQGLADQMQVVINANSLSGPLTGIGYYTLNLIEGLQETRQLEGLRLLSHGRLIELPQDERKENRANARSADDANPVAMAVSKLRASAAKSKAIVALYDTVIPVIARRSLRAYGSGDIFHSPDFQYASFPGRTIVTIPDLSTLTFPQFHPASRVEYVNRHIRRAVEHADHIVAISDYVREEIIEKLGIEKERVTTIYPGVDPYCKPISRSEFESHESGTGLNFKDYFLFVSTIEPRKNLTRLLQAYDRYAQLFAESALPLYIVGHPGWNSEQIHSTIRELSRKVPIVYLGYLERGKLRRLLAGARALLFPSLYEGFGLPVLEAMGSGTAVLTSSSSAMSEIAGEAALLVSPLDTEDMAQKIVSLHKDADLVTHLEREGIHRSRSFSWQLCAQQTLSLYRSIVGGV